MQIPPEITYRNLDKTEPLEALIQEKISKLEETCDHISSCRIAIEKIHDHPKSGSPYRVRLDLTVPPGHELAVDKNPNEGTQYVPLETVIRDAFEAARRQLSELVQRQRYEVKHHEQQEMVAIVSELFSQEDYGFIKTLDGREVYFNRNSVLQDDFDRLEVGTGVQFSLQENEKGSRASSLRIVNKPGAHIGQAEESIVEPPRGW
mgnify:CR=1 FL=1